MTLAPGAGGEIVTSECGRVDAVDPLRCELGATMDDGRFQRFAGDDLEPARLAHGYAVTVHRSQGATVSFAHALEDGGGRELAYVKMSRARQRSTVYVVADDVDQAADDLRWAWAQSRRIGWVIDRAAVDQGRPTRPVGPEEGPEAGPVAGRLRHARLVAERDALLAAMPVPPGPALFDAQADVRHLEAQRRALDATDGHGVLRGTSVGEAATELATVVAQRRAALGRMAFVGPLERRRLHREAARLGEAEGLLRDAFDRLARPERDRIDRELPRARDRAADLEREQHAYDSFHISHPEVHRRLEHLGAAIDDAAYAADLEREHLDGVRPARPDPAELRHQLELDRLTQEAAIDLVLEL